MVSCIPGRVWGWWPAMVWGTGTSFETTGGDQTRARHWRGGNLLSNYFVLFKIQVGSR